jgi:hypothetical protein
LVVLVVACALSACGKKSDAKHLDLELIRVSGDAKLRTDTVGAGKFEETATFVLVDAENTARDGAYVTLGGEITDGKAVVGTLRPQSLWIPAGESRTFALVDADRKPKPAAAAARIFVRGALLASPPKVRVEDVKVADNFGQAVASGTLVSEANRLARAIVIASFHDAGGRPMTRPFELIEIGPAKPGERHQACSRTPENDQSYTIPCAVQFIGPAGSKTARIYVGEISY